MNRAPPPLAAAAGSTHARGAAPVIVAADEARRVVDFDILLAVGVLAAVLALRALGWQICISGLALSTEGVQKSANLV